MRIRAIIGVAAAVLASGTGCADDPRGVDLADRIGLPTRAVPLGLPSLPPSVRGKTVLFVGDSWARVLATGAAEADGRNTVVNAGLDGCGLMQPACEGWPQRWRALVVEHRPTAVVLAVGFQDGQDRRLPGDTLVRGITDLAFRERFDLRVDRAVRVLSATGAPVYLPTVADGTPPGNATAMNDALRAAAARNADRARLLDLRGQLCRSGHCPRHAAGTRIYDGTRHPTPKAARRLGAWILHTVSGPA